METKSKKSNWSVTRYIFAGCMFLGMGTGMLLNSVSMTTGMFIGMGAGFVIAALVKIILDKK